MSADRDHASTRIEAHVRTLRSARDAIREDVLIFADHDWQNALRSVDRMLNSAINTLRAIRGGLELERTIIEAAEQNLGQRIRLVRMDDAHSPDRAAEH